MSDNQNNQRVVSERALEMLMRDVIDSLSEFALESGFTPTDGGFEIIEIYPDKQNNAKSGKDHRDGFTDTESGDILRFPNLRRAVG
jgi:hypothetical protein